MAIPVIEKIARAIATRLESTPAVSGKTIAGVARPTRTAGYTLKDMQIVVMQENRDKPLQINQGNSPSIDWVYAFRIEMWSRPSDSSTTPIDTFVNEFLANVEKTLMSDPTFGGLAWNGELGETEHIFGDDGVHEGASLKFYATYRVSERDPYIKQ